MYKYIHMYMYNNVSGTNANITKLINKLLITQDKIFYYFKIQLIVSQSHFSS